MNGVSRIATIGLLVGTAACNKGGDETKTMDQTGAAPVDTVVVAPKAAVPEALARVKGMAEKAKAEVQAARWPSASAMADSLRQSYQEIKAHVAQADSSLDRQISKDMDDLDAAIRDKTTDAADKLAQSLRDAADKIDRTY